MQHLFFQTGSPVAQWLVYRLLIKKAPRSVLSLSINGIVLKIQIKNHRVPRVHGDRRLVKSVESKVQTVRAYDVAENTAVCQLGCRPRHLTMDLNYEA